MADMRCENCRFWDREQSGHTYADCRRQPPQFDLSVHVRRDGYDPVRDTVTVSRFPHARWPNTSKDDWCGEFIINAHLDDLP